MPTPTSSLPSAAGATPATDGQAVPAGVAAAINSIRAGRPVVVRHEGKTMLVSAAAVVNTELVRLYERATAAPLAVALDAPLFDRLGLDLPAVPGSGFPHGMTVDADAADPFAAMSRSGRADTIRALARHDADRFTSPGHVTPLRSSPGNLLTRVGLVGAAVDLVGLAGLAPAALVSFMVDESGSFRDIALWPEQYHAAVPV
ncbi:hypothetical protein HER39_18470, partial [Arthrobacter deserti]|nr:hypothetical protein [Arthrobacter deserti]